MIETKEEYELIKQPGQTTDMVSSIELLTETLEALRETARARFAEALSIWKSQVEETWRFEQFLEHEYPDLVPLPDWLTETDE